ncbi:hypothetical protein TRFO_07119 [Tritrichomonas foetus]|uniref:Uncharacterized protein n=1 Tax=Tritrichomonas foetus TaxID=1144522 RepID=A0A1J4JYG0_9EUKA|nr:hypothetical protein TRFO_07119 [Tritrichomonas foetus]|eukprot:OHT02309.1 hypothetical protein TRFO_07119 [Tritrichomonas foetus]
MPPKVQVNSIPYGKKGIIPATVTKFEKEMLEKIDEKEIDDYSRSLLDVGDSTAARRDAQHKNEIHQLDFDEVKRYLTLKIRDKEQKHKFYQNKLKEIRQEREDLISKMQAEQDQLKQNHELELTQLTNTLKANKQRRDALATVAAMEIQLKREIDEAEQTLKREKAQQSQQTSQALAEFYMLHVRQQKELRDGVEREKAKNRGMTSENLEKTVIEMMKEIDAEIKKYTALVMEARDIADINSKFMKLNKQKYMERDLLQQESDEAVKKINKNDQKIRKLVEELKQYDQKMTNGLGGSTTDIIEEAEESKEAQATMSRAVQQQNNAQSDEQSGIQNEGGSEKPYVDREALLNQFFHDSVRTLCNSVVKILTVYDPTHSQDYSSFHEVFNSFEGRKKELRFLMSKLGNLTFQAEDRYQFPPVGLEDVEGADEEITSKKIVEPQKKAILEFAEPIADDELPDLIATHFFQ